MRWLSRVLKRYRQIAVTGDLHKSRKISSNFEMEIKVIKYKFQNADYLPKFLNSIINQFLTRKNND